MASEGSLLSLVGERLNSRDGVLALGRCTMAGSTASARLGRSPRQSMSYSRGCSSVTAVLSGLGPELQVAGWLLRNTAHDYPPRSAWIHLGGNNTGASIGPRRFSFVSAQIHQFLTTTLNAPLSRRRLVYNHRIRPTVPMRRRADETTPAIDGDHSEPRPLGADLLNPGVPSRRRPMLYPLFTAAASLARVSAVVAGWPGLPIRKKST
ncbi:hypothetical protein LA080_002715 [Diaporthe eres]|nr:hypothetical protein LA080_002715 [Diaporthe eres]